MAQAVNDPKKAHVRDQDATPFSVILTDLCRATGACCAALVDREGETVDYGGEGEPFDIRILAAEWRLVLQHVEHSRLFARTMEVVVRAPKNTYLVDALPEGYALVMQLESGSADVSERALELARKRICEEAGFAYERRCDVRWAKVAVEEEAGSSRRPVRMFVDESCHEVTVLGLIHDAEAARDRSYRVRLSNGEERTLVREPLGHWYVEEETWE